MQVGKAFGKWSNVFEIGSTSMKGRWDGLKMLISFYQINGMQIGFRNATIQQDSGFGAKIFCGYLSPNSAK